MLNKKNQVYIDYVIRLMEEKFSGKVIINLQLGGVSHLNKKFEPEPPMVVEESVKLKP